MGAILDTPHTEKTVDTGNGNNLLYAVCSMQGWRVEMEDAHCARIGLPGLPDWSFFAVFDGHAGASVSAHCAENLLNTILKTESFSIYATASLNCQTKKQSNSTNGDSSVNDDDELSNSIETNNGHDHHHHQQHVDCNEMNGDGAASCQDTLERIKSSIKDGFLKLDEKMKTLPEVESGEDISGSTAVCCLISPTHMFFANCGDSRAVLSRDGCAFFSTQDHKPINPAEKERIQAAGGSVMISRVNGSLAVSRALGDYQYKQVVGRGPCEQLVSPEPEITIQERDAKDEFLILACDGIWDVMSNDDLCKFVRHQLCINSNLEQVCSLIIDTCLHKGSTDNMSVVLVTFAGVPKLDEDIIRKDNELNKNIENEVINLLKQHPDYSNSMYQLMQSLKNTKFDDLPPGGGLDAKRSFIEEIHTRYVEENNGESNTKNNNS